MLWKLGATGFLQNDDMRTNVEESRIQTHIQNLSRGACIHLSNRREFNCSRVRQFEDSNKKLYEKASLTPQFTATKYQ